jgi:ATP-dependent Clp protease protease subunit
VLRLKTITNDILKRHTKKSLKEIEADTLRDHFMDAQEAMKYGIIDKIMEKHELPKSISAA